MKYNEVAERRNAERRQTLRRHIGNANTERGDVAVI